MSKHTVVAKFGGTSLADSSQFRKVIEIVRENPERRYIVVSAPGKRCSEDCKITDLLLACYEKAKTGESFSAELNQIRTRFHEILTDLNMEFPLDNEIERLEESLITNPMKDFTASRGEYLTAKILAENLGFTFVDPSWCICFDENGNLDQTMTVRTIRASLLPLKHAVIAGFYGADMSGTIHTFERGAASKNKKCD